MPTLFVPGYGDIEYHEVPIGSPTLQLSHGSSSVERTFLVSWDDLDGFVKGMLGFCYIKTVFDEADPFRQNIARILPQSAPYSTPRKDNDFWLYATSIRQAIGKGPIGIEDEDGVSTYEQAAVTVGYEGLSYKLVSDEDMAQFAYNNHPTYVNEASLQRYVTKSQKPSAEFITLPRGTMKWYDPIRLFTKRQCIDSASRLVPTVEINWTWHQVPFVPQAALLHIGKVNNAAFTYQPVDQDGDTRARTYPAGTLLMLGAEIKPYRLASGSFVQDIVYRIKYMDNSVNKPGNVGLGIGHNFFLRYIDSTNNLAYYKLTHNGKNDSQIILPQLDGGPYDAGSPIDSGIGLYQYAAFEDLFRYTTTTP